MSFTKIPEGLVPDDKVGVVVTPGMQGSHVEEIESPHNIKSVPIENLPKEVLDGVVVEDLNSAEEVWTKDNRKKLGWILDVSGTTSIPHERFVKADDSVWVLDPRNLESND